MKKVWLIILIVITSLWVLMFALTTHSVSNEPLVQKGIIDLRDQDFNSGNKPLKGQWEFYWNELLTPQSPLPQTNYTQFPGLWNKIKINGKSISSIGYATYRLTILLPKNYPPIAIRIPDIYTSYRLYINDSMEIEIGNPAIKKEDARPFWSERTITLPAKIDTAIILLQVANYWHSKGGPHKPIMIGKLSTLIKQNRTELGLKAITTGFILMSSFLFFGLYLFAKKDKAILFFALFCFAYSYRILGAGPYLIFAVFQDVNWFLMLRIEYLSLVLSLAFFFQYIYYLYPNETNMEVKKIYLILSTFYGLIILVTPVKLFSSLLPIYLIILFFYLGYAFYIFITAYIHKRKDSDFALLSACIVFVLFLFLNLNYFKLAPVMNSMLSSGYILFLFLQAIILSSRFESILSYSARQAQLGATAKSEFLSTMSHEIRTPLNTIVGLSHILLKEKPSATQKKALDLVLFSADNLLILVNDILDYSKLEAGKTQLEKIEIDLREIGNNIINSEQNFATDKNIQLEYEVDNLVPDRLISDPTRIAQVIGNLVHNAIKFTDKGWVKLSLHTQMVDASQAIITFTIKDSGIGISQEEQKIIFKGFTQADSSTSRKYGGTGLGLAICIKILKLFRTTLQLRSTPGEGSEFWFTLSLPIATNKKILPLENPNLIESDKPLLGYCILLAEDNQLNAMIAKTILTSFGAKVDISENGKEAIERFDPFVHNIIIMDVNMPEIDGYEATRQLRKMGVTIPIIALTANLASEITEKAKEAGMTDIVGKPFNPLALSKTILKYKM